MAVIRFDPNTVVEIALKYDGGKEITSRIPDAPNQMMYTLCGDDTIYVPLHVADQITKLGIKRAELFSVCKRVSGNVTRWEVKRVGDTVTEALAPNSFEALPTAIPQQKVNPSKSMPTAAVATVPAPVKAPAQTPNSTHIHHTGYSRTMAAALIAAIDSAREAERYATAVGIPVKPLTVEFLAEDIRAIAATMFIQASKEPGFLTQPTQKVNGGTTWQQQ